MIARIYEHLEKKTRNGNALLLKTLRGKKDEIRGIADEYVYFRARKEGYIRVKSFCVELVDERTKRIVGKWAYTPTYR